MRTSKTSEKVTKESVETVENFQESAENVKTTIEKDNHQSVEKTAKMNIGAGSVMRI